MIEEVKAQLAESPEAIIRILEAYGFARITRRQHEIRCAFEEGMNPTAIVLKLKDNPACLVKDYEKNVCCDLINYLIKVKKHTFKDVISRVKSELGIDNIYNYRRRVGLFGGLYDRVARRDDAVEIKIYPESILDEYLAVPNERFLQDGISIEAQKKFQIGYDAASQRITIPIRTPYGELAGVKGRCNYTPDEFEPKYLYLTPAPMSQLLYGFYENHDTLLEGDIKIFESEKSVLILDSMGMHDGVALGSNSLSTAQAKLLLSLKPNSITFLMDEGLPLENTLKNIETLRSLCSSHEPVIKYFDWTHSISLPSKAAPVDCGKETYEYILKNELVTYKGGSNDAKTTSDPARE